MSNTPTAHGSEIPLRKHRDLYSRLAQGASFLFLAACLSVTYECLQIHDSKAGQPENPLADSSLTPVEPNPNTPEAASQDGFLSSALNFLGLDGKKEETKEEPVKTPTAPTLTVAIPSGNPGPSTSESAQPSEPKVNKVKPLDFNFLEVSKPSGLQTYDVTQRISGDKIAYSLNLNPGWGEQSRTLVDKSFFHTSGLNLFIFAEPPDPLKVVRAEKYQERYAQMEVDKIAATHPSLIPFEFKEDVRSFRFRHWGKFQFIHNGVTKLILYTHAGRNGKYSLVISSQEDLLKPEMRRIWISAAESFEVDHSQTAKDPESQEGGEAPAPTPPAK